MDLGKGLDQLVEKTMKEWHTPGLCMMMVKGNEIIYEKGFGYRNLETHEVVTPNTVFVGASTTKAFTAAALGILVDKGVLAWETPLHEYIPELNLSDVFIRHNLTVTDLLTHRTGYPRHDKIWLGSDKSRKELLQGLRYLQPNCGFRSTWQYNNLMYVLAGYLVEALSGETWEEFLQNKIMMPVGMTRSSFTISDMEKMDDFAYGYAWEDGAYKRAPFMRADHIGPAGSLNTCGRDMARWILLQIGQGTYGNQEIVSRKTMEEIHTPRIVAPSFLPGSYAEILHTQYAFGWFSAVYRGNRMIYHVGNLDGFYALVSFMPDVGLGQVILTNMTPNRAPYALSYSVYDQYLQLSPVDWNERIRENVTALEKKEEDMLAIKKKERILGTHPSFPMIEYEGSYSHPAYGKIAIYRKGDTYSIRLNEFEARLEHFHYDTFSCEGEKKGFPGLTLASFQNDGRGKICRVLIPLEPAEGAEKIVFMKTDSDLKCT